MRLSHVVILLWSKTQQSEALCRKSCQTTWPRIATQRGCHGSKKLNGTSGEACGVLQLECSWQKPGVRETCLAYSRDRQLAQRNIHTPEYAWPCRPWWGVLNFSEEWGTMSKSTICSIQLIPCFLRLLARQLDVCYTLSSVLHVLSPPPPFPVTQCGWFLHICLHQYNFYCANTLLKHRHSLFSVAITEAWDGMI